MIRLWARGCASTRKRNARRSRLLRTEGFGQRGLPLAAVLLSLAPGLAQAHSFGARYDLPLPVSLYSAAMALVLVLSFAAGAFVKPAPRRMSGALWLRSWQPARPVLLSLRALALLTLVATMTLALVGSNNPYGNISMNLFWVAFVLGWAYVCVLTGNSYALLNPWQSLCELLEWTSRRRLFAGRFKWPAFGTGLALLLYLIFIAYELFGDGRPRSLGHWLLGYTALNLIMASLYGARIWFREGELFGLLFERLSRGAPWRWTRDRVFRLPIGWGWVQRGRVGSLGLLFILFMLASTAYDGLHETQLWVDGFWAGVYPMLQPWLGESVVQNFPLLKRSYNGYQLAGLVLIPLLYWAVFMFCLAWMRALAADRRPLGELASFFVFSLLPIAAGYHFAHYFSLMLNQGQQFWRLISDPLGRGQNLFGTAHWMASGPVLPAETVWHIQVVAIGVGHVAATLVAHRITLRLYPETRRALWIQLPLLCLMVAYTASGLWILAQPLSQGTV